MRLPTRRPGRWPVRAAILALAAAPHGPLLGQADSLTPTALRAPQSPAFVLLGVEPSTIARPSTPRAVATTLLSGVDRGDLVPNNLALEVGPYWLASHPTLTFNDYYNAGPGAQLYRNLSLSVATSKSGAAGAIPAATAVGVGVRTAVFLGGATAELSRLRATLSAIQDSILDTDDEALQDALAKRARKVALSIQSEARRRGGLALEVAGALVADFPANNASDGRVTRLGGWLTVGYTASRPELSLLGVARYLDQDRTIPDNEFVDVGGRVVFEPGDFSLSAEYTRRISTAPAGAALEGTYRFSGNAEYRVSEDLTVAATFGRDYFDVDLDAARLIAVIAANVGFGWMPKLSALP